MQGIQFVTNDKGEKVAVQIDLRKHAIVWEDVYDSITARNRSREPRESIESVKGAPHQATQTEWLIIPFLLHDPARKELESLSAKLVQRIFPAIEALAKEPRPKGCRKLTTEKNL